MDYTLVHVIYRKQPVLFISILFIGVVALNVDI